MGLSGAQPLGEVKTKAPNSDYSKLDPPVAARSPLRWSWGQATGGGGTHVLMCWAWALSGVGLASGSPRAAAPPLFWPPSGRVPHLAGV